MQPLHGSQGPVKAANNPAVPDLWCWINFKRFRQTVFLVMNRLIPVCSRRVETGFLPYYTIISWDEVRLLTPLLDYQQKQTPNKKFTFSKQKENFQSCHPPVSWGFENVSGHGIQYSYRLLALSWQLHLLPFNLVWCQENDW